MFFVVNAYSQSAKKITEIINAENVTYGQFSYLIANALSLASENSTDDEALSILQENKIAKENKSSKDILTAKEASFVCANGWNISGSLMYKLVPSSHYAFKLLKAKKFIPATMESSHKLTGHEALFLVNHLLEVSEGVEE